MRKAKKYIFIASAIVFIAGTAAFVLFSPLFTVREINIIGAKAELERDIVALLPFNIGENIFFISAKDGANAIRKDGRIQFVEIHKKLPDRIDVIVEEEHPVLLIAHEKIWGLSESGKIIPIQNAYEIPNLPFISGIGEGTIFLEYKKPYAPRLALALAFWDTVKSVSPEFVDKISEVHVNEDSSIQMILAGDGIVVEFGRKDYQRKLLRLIVVLDDLKQKRSEVAGIDLRYSDQAVVQMSSQKNKNAG